MDNKKIKLFSSILEGRKKACDAYFEYLEFEKNTGDSLKLDHRNNLKTKYNDFRVKLYNYVNAIKNKKSYFENYKIIEYKLNRVVIEKDHKNLYMLFKAFRHKNEHPENVEYEEDYINFNKCVTKEMLYELLETCNDVVEQELKRFDQDSLLQVIICNPDLKQSVSDAKTKFDTIRNKETENDFNVHYDHLISELTKIDYENAKLDDLDSAFKEMNEYMNRKGLYALMENSMSKETYEKFQSIGDIGDDSSVEEFKKRVENFFVSLLEETTKK